jgi:hypothetical protein
MTVILTFKTASLHLASGVGIAKSAGHAALGHVRQAVRLAPFRHTDPL